MSTFAPTAEFSPADVSDNGLAELRRLSIDCLRASAEFGAWLHSWCDKEQARRAKREATATQRHVLGIPLMQSWSNKDVGECLEAVGVLVHCVQEFTACQFAERLQMAVSMESALRLKQLPTEVSTDARS